MSGIYIHIPFCKKACHYCNFHFSTQLERKNELVDSIVTEIQWRQDYLQDKNIETIYLGGGTPSLLSAAELDKILKAIYDLFNVSPNVEITLEANPDDLSPDKLISLKRSGVNRLSIGVQSFFQTDLEYMNRSHNVDQAISSIDDALGIGFENISIDLIYGAPTTTDDMWQDNVTRAIAFGVTHLSCYALTVEPNTALAHFIKSKKMVAPKDEKAAVQFEYLVKATTKAGWLHYEISNFAKPEMLSQHNTNYWRGVPYLGIGPAAHSFNGHSRQWNISHNIKYIDYIIQQNKTELYEVEQLSSTDQTNEYVMTSLRTMWGVDLSHIAPDEHRHKIVSAAKIYLDQDILIQEGDRLLLSPQAKFLADGIASALFV